MADRWSQYEATSQTEDRWSQFEVAKDRWSQFEVTPQESRFDRLLQGRPQTQLEAAASPFLRTPYLSLYQQPKEELERLRSAWSAFQEEPSWGGAGGVALGALGSLISPITGAFRGAFGEPIEQATGLPQEYGTAASMAAVPFGGMSSTVRSGIQALKPAARAATEALTGIEAAQPKVPLSPYRPQIESIPAGKPRIKIKPLAQRGQIIGAQRAKLKDPLFEQVISKENNWEIAEAGTRLYKVRRDLFNPDLKVSDNVVSGILQGRISVEGVKDFGFTSQQFSRIWREGISKQASSMAKLSHIARKRKAAEAAKIKAGQPIPPGGLVPEEMAEKLAESGAKVPDIMVYKSNWKRLGDAWVGSLVAPLTTTMKNIVGTGGYLGVNAIEKPLEAVLQKLYRAPLGADVKVSAYDGVETAIRLFGRNKKTFDEVAKVFPNVEDRLIAISSVDTATRVGQKGALGGLESFVHAVNVLNRAQNDFFVRGIFNATLDQRLRKAGLGSIDELAAKNRLSEIPKTFLDDSIENALEFTFNAKPARDTGAWHIVQAISKTPLRTVQPFARFIWQSWRFFSERNPLAFLRIIKPSVRERIANGNTSDLAKAMTGSVLFGAAVLARNSEVAGEKWNEIVMDDGKPWDAQSYPPFSNYLFAADLLKRSKEGTLDTLTARDVVKGLTGIRAGSGFLILDQALKSFETGGLTEKAWRIPVEFAGKTISGFAQPFTQLRDIYDALTEGESILRETRTNPLIDPTIAQLPIASRLLPEAEIPTRSGPIRYPNPLVKQVTGVPRKDAKNFLEKETDRLGFTSRKIYSPVGIHRLDTLAKKYLGDLNEAVLIPIVTSPEYRAADDRVKSVMLEEQLNVTARAARSMAEAQATQKELEYLLRKRRSVMTRRLFRGE